jgi:hypothetical protein
MGVVTMARSWIHEFPHPRVVVHFHSVGVPTLDQVSEALQQGVHAVELDLHFRPGGPGGGDVFCGHDGLTPNSPRLSEMIKLILDQKAGHPTVQGDGRQFFLVLEPKDDDRRLFDGIYQILLDTQEELSTAAEPGTGPRAITVVITGNYVLQCTGWLLARHGAGANRLLIGEAIDYTGVIEDLSGAKPPATFQWVALQYDDALAGHVNALHMANDPGYAGRFNARAWDTDDDDKFTQALAAGFDSVNCDPGDAVRFQQIMASQRPRGRLPWLTARNGQATLVWRGADSENLYLSRGTIGPGGLQFSRQICLSTFLRDRPFASAPSAVLLPDGRILAVYQGTDAQRLWYVSGRFDSADRFLAFAGAQFRLTLPDDAGRRGSLPAVAVAPDGRIVVVYEGTDEERLWYVSGFLNAAGQLIGPEYELTEGNARRGHAPTVAFAPTGEVVVVYEGTDQHRLWYVSGTIDSTGQIVGQEHRLSQGDARRGSTPCVAFNGEGLVVVVYEGTSAQRLWYISGRLIDGQIQGREFELTQGDARRGSRPTIAFGAAGTAAVLYQGTDEAKLWYVLGQSDAQGQLIGEESLLDMHLDPL